MLTYFIDCTVLGCIFGISPVWIAKTTLRSKHKKLLKNKSLITADLKNINVYYETS